jgi:hypothetical protein
MSTLKHIAMNQTANGIEAILIGITGGFTAALFSGLGITLGVTAMVTLTSVVAKEIGLRLIKMYDIYKNNKRKKS